MNLHRHRYPWTPEDDATLIALKADGASHKEIARELNRSPRSVDQMVAKFKEVGLLKIHRREELDLLNRVLAESTMPDVGERL